MTLITVSRPTYPYVLDMARCTDGTYYDDGFTTSDFVGSVLAREWGMREAYSEADVPAANTQTRTSVSATVTNRLSNAAPSFSVTSGTFSARI